jgi:hypothetical protein
MKFKTRRHTFDSFFTLLLLLVFALFTVLLCAVGATIYRSGVTHLNENYTSRTAIAYLNEKVRQHDALDTVFLTEVEDCSAIGFRDTIDDNAFVTYVYYYDSALRELFVREETTPLAEMGSRIVELSDFTLSPVSSPYGQPQLLQVTAADPDGDSLSLLIRIRSEAGQIPSAVS